MATYRQTKYEVVSDVSEYDIFDDEGNSYGTVEVFWDLFGGREVSIVNDAGVVEDHDQFAGLLGFDNLDELLLTLLANDDTTRRRLYAVMVLGGAQ
jgi:hypothetical protein